MKDQSLALAALMRAESKNPYSPFVVSCRQQWESRGFLSEKQITVLNRIEPRVSSFYYSPEPQNEPEPARSVEKEWDGCMCYVGPGLYTCGGHSCGGDMDSWP